MDNDKDLLIASAARLYSMGIDRRCKLPHSQALSFRKQKNINLI
jgi:hypothetical protein